MEQLIITDFENYISFVEERCPKHTCFRGVSKEEFDLLPSIGRTLPKKKTHQEVVDFLKRFEMNTMRVFRSSSYHFHNNYGICEIELLALAQHHGLRTRLLDWTRSALVALFFAVEKDKDTDGAIYVYIGNNKIGFIDGLKVHKINPY